MWDDDLAFMHAHGIGQMIYPNGDKYTGEFRRNLRHGQGKLECANKKEGVYEGTFEDDLPHGHGKLRDTCGGMRGQDVRGTLPLGKGKAWGALSSRPAPHTM